MFDKNKANAEINTNLSNPSNNYSVSHSWKNKMEDIQLRIELQKKYGVIHVKCFHHYEDGSSISNVLASKKKCLDDYNNWIKNNSHIFVLNMESGNNLAEVLDREQFDEHHNDADFGKGIECQDPDNSNYFLYVYYFGNANHNTKFDVK